VQSLKRKIEEQAGQCPVMVFSGSLPPGVPPEIYAEFIRIARNRGARTILDTAGAALKYGIAAGPDLIKPNRAEAEEVLETRIDGEAALLGAARRFLEMGAKAVVCLWARTEPWPLPSASGGELILPQSPLRAASARGRDGCRLGPRHDAGLDAWRRLRLATAAGAATVATNGSATELGSIQDYAKAVTLHSIGEAAGAC